MKTENIKEFLQETYYCDFSNPEIKNIACNFKKEYSDDTELAKKLFYFVRDTTTYRVGHWTRKASETLFDKSGTCTNNANLLVALLRACKIPSGYGIMDVVGPSYFGPVVLPHLSRHVSNKSRHIYCYVYLNDKWIKCDPSDDEPLSLNTAHLNPQSKIVEWNGISDAMLNLNPTHIMNDEGPISNIDHIIGKKMRKRLRVPVFFGNLYIQFLRENGKKVRYISELSNMFDKWLLRNNFFAYTAYKTYFAFESVVKFEFISSVSVIDEV